MTDPNSWTCDVTVSSDVEAIAMIQQRLVEWGWLEKDSYAKGNLDAATVQAVIDFQNACNASGLSVPVADASNPIVDVTTLRLLFNADGMVLTR